MRTALRVISGSLRGRKIVCNVSPQLRPTPQKVREALFSLLHPYVAGRPFLDVFAGTGIVGIEAISRGASMVNFVERDFRLAAALQEQLKTFGVAEQGLVARTDAYRWVERWQPPPVPVNVLISPPFADFERRPDALVQLLEHLQAKVAGNSAVVLQGEHDAPLEEMPAPDEWDDRRYGRNHLLIWRKQSAASFETGEKGTEAT